MKKAMKTRSEVFADLQSNPAYTQLHKAKDELEKSLKHARAARSATSIVKGLERSFDSLVKRMIKLEDAALKKAGH